MNKINLLKPLFVLFICVCFLKCSNKNFVANEYSSQDKNETKSNKFLNENKKYKLVWADEFNASGLPDSSKWGYDIGTGDWGWGNNEKEYYTNRFENVNISNGILKINAIKEEYKGSAYTSTRMLTKGKYAFTYGKVVVRAKLPAGLGTWPAIWMLSDNFKTVGWPQCGEIDIMEHKGSELNKIYATLHYPEHFGNNGDGNTTMIKDATTSFHIYTAEWSATEIKFYVDNILFKTFLNSPKVPFNHDFHIILNLAMGGNFAGTLDPTITNATMEVDYVRVYQK